MDIPAIEVQGVAKIYSLFWRTLAIRLAQAFGLRARRAAREGADPARARARVQALRDISDYPPVRRWG